MEHIDIKFKNNTNVSISEIDDYGFEVSFHRTDLGISYVSLPIEELELKHYPSDTGIDIVMEELQGELEDADTDDIIALKKALISFIDKVSAKVYWHGF